MPELIVPPARVCILWGDGRHDDRLTLRHLFKGGTAYDSRIGVMINAPTLKQLPAGCYRTCPAVED